MQWRTSGCKPAGTPRMERGAEVHSSWDRGLDRTWKMQGRVERGMGVVMEACSARAVARQLWGGWRLELRGRAVREAIAPLPSPFPPHPPTPTVTPLLSFTPCRKCPVTH